eukprot:1161264-Pelagomonas_calceolata.AAC.1
MGKKCGSAGGAQGLPGGPARAGLAQTFDARTGALKSKRAAREAAEQTIAQGVATKAARKSASAEVSEEEEWVPDGGEEASEALDYEQPEGHARKRRKVNAASNLQACQLDVQLLTGLQRSVTACKAAVEEATTHMKQAPKTHNRKLQPLPESAKNAYHTAGMFVSALAHRWRSCWFFLRGKTIRSHHPSYACLMDFDFEFTFQLLQLALADQNLVQRYNLQTAQEEYMAELDSLQEAILGIQIARNCDQGQCTPARRQAVAAQLLPKHAVRARFSNGEEGASLLVADIHSYSNSALRVPFVAKLCRIASLIDFMDQALQLAFVL